MQEVTDGKPEQIHAAMDRICAEYERYCREAYQKSLQFDYKAVNQKVFQTLNDSLHWERSRG